MKLDFIGLTTTLTCSSMWALKNCHHLCRVGLQVLNLRLAVIKTDQKMKMKEETMKLWRKNCYLCYQMPHFSILQCLLFISGSNEGECSASYLSLYGSQPAGHTPASSLLHQSIGLMKFCCRKTSSLSWSILNHAREDAHAGRDYIPKSFLSSLLTSQVRMHAQCTKCNTMYSTMRRRASLTYVKGTDL